MTKHFFHSLAGVLLLAAVPASAARLPESVVFRENGSFQFGETQFQIQCYSENWIGTVNPDWKNLKSKLTPEGLDLTATLNCGAVPAAVTETVRPLDDNGFRLTFNAKFDRETRPNSVHGALFLPAAGKSSIHLDGKEFPLPAEPDQLIVVPVTQAREFAYTARNGVTMTVTGEKPLRVMVQDNRKLGSANTFAVRFSATPPAGPMRDCRLSLDFRFGTPKSIPVDLVKVANMGYCDEVAGDGKGGWTDQGPENDLRDFTPGVVEVDQVKFVTLDPARNQGRAALVLAGAGRGGFPGEATIELPPGNGARAVNFLHGSAWTPAIGAPLGEIVAHYADGSSRTIPVVARGDVGNWWNPVKPANAVIGWQSENPEAKTGLYATSFPLPVPDPVALTLRVRDAAAMWMLVGMTLTDRPVTFRAFNGAPVVLREGKEWAKLDFSGRIEKGSALDFSFLADAPAGKYGRVIAAENGTLTFEKAPEKRLRLYGANLCFSASFLDRKTVDRLAEQFVRNGYNTVRIHHHDTELLVPGAKDTLTFDPEKLDKLDYLFYRMKESGLYITTDFYTNRTFKPGDGIPECTFYDQRQMKMLLPVSRAAMENWKEFVRRWMTHRNPYTGMTWAEDPAFYCVNLVNEETLSANWDRSPESVKLYQQAFRRYLAERGLDPATPAVTSNPVFFRFLNELQEKVLAEQIDFVKSEVKMKALVTSLNFINDLSLSLLRQRFDVVDNHAYFDHPGFVDKPWNLPYSYQQDSAIARMAAVPANMMPTRIFGKPFLVTEFNYCAPNIFRAEGGPVIGAYAALQNWDALYRFAWSHDKKDLSAPNGLTRFDAVDDPLAQLSDRIAVMMFRRGDVKAAEARFGYVVPRDILDLRSPNSAPAAFRNLGLIAQIGTVPEGFEPKLAVKLLNSEQAANPDALGNPAVAALWRDTFVNRRVAVSSTGQIRLDSRRKEFTVKTDLTESVTLPSGTLSAGILRVSEADSFQTVAAISLDGKPLAGSGSILLLHLSDVGNSNYTFANELRNVVTAVGGRPLLVRRAAARVELSSDRPFRVEALNSEGRSYGEIKGSFHDGVFEFPVDTTRFPGGVLAYHLTR